MTKQNKAERMVEIFYRALDEGTLDNLSEKEVKAVERAVMVLGGRDDHIVDWRVSFPFFFKRFYMVFLLGRDFRQQQRERSVFTILFLSLVVTIIGSILTVAIVLFLYLIKSALGIDIFEYFSFGVWDWFKELIGVGG